MTNALSPWRDEMSSFRTAMNKLFEDFSRGFEPLSLREGFMPRVDVSEDEKDVHVQAELPGMDEKDIDLSLSSGVLTIKGEKRTEHEEKKKNYYRIERSYGAFQRTVPMPCEVDPDKIAATFSKGVLNVKLAKTAAAQQQIRKIPVKTA